MKPKPTKKSYQKKKLTIPKVVPLPKMEEPLKIIGGLPEKKRKHYAIPKAVIQQVAEFSNGGYYLISFSHRGVPFITCNADSPSHGVALKDFCVNYFHSLSKAEREIMEKSVFHEVITGAMRQHPGDKEDDSDGPDLIAVS